RAAHQKVYERARVAGNDMGTTIAAMLVVGRRAFVVNVGDTRAYLWREGTLKRLTRDHSYVMIRLVEKGELTEDAIYTHPQRNVLLRTIGQEKLAPDVDATTIDLQ